MTATTKFTTSMKNNQKNNNDQRSKSSTDVITVITRDNIRKLKAHPPHGDPNEFHRNPILLVPYEYSRIKNAAVFQDVDKHEQFLQSTRDKVGALEEGKQRKLLMEDYDRKRHRQAKLSETEKESDNYLLEKAQVQLDEEEDEVKKVNEMMLYAKCRAIRDIQIEEKKLIEEKRKQEEMRLDQMMEKDRQNAIKKMEEDSKMKEQIRRKGAEVIRKQIDERREAFLLEQEKRDQETKAVLKYIADVTEQERVEKYNKFLTQRNHMREVMKANEESILRKRQQKLQDQDEDRRVLQYLLEKERKEVDEDMEKERKRAEREKELARLAQAQKRITDAQAEQDMLRARRAQEAYEREWRTKEKEEAEKLTKQEIQLREERLQQQQAREHAIAVEARKLKEEFYENLERQKEQEEKYKKEEDERKLRNKEYAKGLKAQISERTAERSKEREDFYLQGIRQKMETIDRQKKLDHIKSRKVDELRQIGIPDKYCSEFEKKCFRKKETFFETVTKIIRS